MRRNPETALFSGDGLDHLCGCARGEVWGRHFIGPFPAAGHRLWGLGLSLINCLVTLVLMVFLLPAGLADGVLSGTALVLMIFAKLGRGSDGEPKLLASPVREHV